MSFVIHTHSGEVYIGDEHFSSLELFLSHKLHTSRIFILTDRHTRVHCLPVLQQKVELLKDAVILTIESGEHHKSLLSCELLWRQLIEAGADRRSLLVNLGGGMIGDIGGFVAATYMRGIEFINIPTTLLAMVDASSGGKNGVNLGGYKNMVGTFTSPSAIFIAPVFLKTLDSRDLRSGFAEMIKHTLIAAPSKWKEIQSVQELNSVDWAPFISGSVKIKNEIVTADFREKNLRKTLNFGHTIGHALESYSLRHHTNPLRHGEAVAAGMVAALHISQRISGLPEAVAESAISFIKHHFSTIQLSVNIPEVIAFVQGDKKNENQALNFVLLKDVGLPMINQRPDEREVESAIRFTLEQFNHPVLKS